MEKYIGTINVDTSTHPVYSKFTSSDWAMLFIEKYGQIDGDHHKSWVLDQVSRILKGTPVTVTQASWENGHTEYRFVVGNPSEEYQEWAEDMLGEFVEGCYEYNYDIGVAP